jgi:ubiquinone/menaquinone biosynthesis C-methylase UbiE
MELEQPWQPMWVPQNHREGKEIELIEAVRIPNRLMQLRDDIGKHGILKYAIPEDKIDQIEQKDAWEENSEKWIEFIKIEDEGDANRRFVIDPALWSLLGDVEGLTILDAGCGSGYLTRLLASKGASSTGIDFSTKFIEYCKKVESEKNLGCVFFVGSLTDMNVFKPKSFDIVVSNVVMIDVLDYRTAFKEIARVLKDDGRFIWSNTHPVFGRAASAGDIKFPKDSSRNEDRYLKMVDRYFDSGGELLDFWAAPTWQFQRTLEEYSKALKEAGFVISEIIEPRPSIEDIQKHPGFLAFDADRWTHFIIYECLKRYAPKKSEQI